MLTNCAASAELFHTATGIAFADITVDGHRETWPIRSAHFRAWLRRQHYQATGDALSSDVIRVTIDHLEARAQFDTPERTINIRVAEHGGCIYLDLADQQWRSVEIGPHGWRVVFSPPVRFRRSAAMLPLPLPEKGGSIEDLSPFLNLSSRDDFALVAAWLMAALRHTGPYPLLALSGEQGSAKTFATRVLRALIDPNAAPVRASPREERELFISAGNSYLLAFDNLSIMAPWLSDALCRLASGGSFAARQLYTDQDEVLFQAARPVILNGIEDIIVRPDLADRAIFLALGPISVRQRRPEKSLWRDFEQVRPAILGALLDAAAQGLRELSHIRLENLPRMADFALWAAACETAYTSAGTFSDAYSRNRMAAVESIIDADPVAHYVRELMAKRTVWVGSATDLLHAGSERTGTISSSWIGWPKNPRTLASRLRRAQTCLRTIGIQITFGREGRAGTRVIKIVASNEDRPGRSL